MMSQTIPTVLLAYIRQLSVFFVNFTCV